MDAELQKLITDQIVMELEAEFRARFQQIEEENDRLRGELNALRASLTLTSVP